MCGRGRVGSIPTDKIERVKLKYIGEKGTVIILSEPSLLTRTLSFTMNDSRTFDSNKMAITIAKHYENVKELRFRERFKFPGGKINHSYYVVFEVPANLIVNSRLQINGIMRDIEDRVEKECNVIVKNKHCTVH